MPTILSLEDYRLLFNEAEQLRHNGQIHAAATAYSNLLRYWLESTEGDPYPTFTINEFFIVDRLADISLLIGKKAAAKHLLSAMTHIEGVMANSCIRIHIVTKLMFIHLHDGQLDDALETIQSLSCIIGDIRDIEISPAGLPEWENSVQFSTGCTEQDEADQFVCLYDALGSLLMTLGQFADSALMLKRAIQIGEKFRSPIVDSRLLSIKILLAKAFFQKGEIQLAKDQLASIENDPSLINIASGIPFHLLDLKSRIAMAQGQLGEAYRLLFKLIQLCHQYSLPLAEIQASFNLAQVKVILNQTHEATDILKDCLLKARQLHENALASRIERFLQVADARSMGKIQPLNYPGAKQRQRIKSKPATPLPSDPVRLGDYMANFEERALLFQLELSANRPDKASEVLDQLRMRIADCDSALIHARFQVLEFMLLFFTNTPIPKDHSYAELLDFFTANQLLPELWQFRTLLGRTDFIPPHNKPDWVKENQQLLDQITNSLPATMRALYLLNKWSPNEEYLASYSHQLLRLKSKTQSAWVPYKWLVRLKFMKQIVAFQETANAYKSYLTHSVAKGLQPGDFSFQKQKASLARMLWRQPKNALVISLLVLPDRIVIISRSFLKVRLHITFINRAALRQLVFSLRDVLYPEGVFREMLLTPTPSPACIDHNELLKHMEEILQLRLILEEHGNKITDASFIADDALHGFPFTLFMLNEALPEKTRTGLSIDHRPQQQTLSFAEMNVTLVGVSGAVAGFNALPGVLKEISKTDQQLTSYGASVQVLLDEDATAEKAKQQLCKSGIIHFSCHGKFDYYHPEQSGLLMGDGCMLTLKDILALEDLSHIRLLVLSSCRGAEHFVLPGRWIIGLPETFCRAGVNAVLAFLWPVNDDFATAFTSKFYEHLKINLPKEAFRLTISDAKNKNLPGLDFEYWHPRFWAGAMFYER